MPIDNSDTAINSTRQIRKPSTVARPTSSRRCARAEYTLAPSMPMKTHTVTSIVLLTWSSTEPSWASPQKSSLKVSIWKAIATSAMNSSSGSSLASVTTALSTVAPRMPRSTSAWMTHNTTDAPNTAAGVLPSPKAGKK